MRRIAIVGSAPSTRHLVPVEDTTLEIWSLNDCWGFLSRADLWFEMHERAHFCGPSRPPQHLEWLRKAAIPIMMHQAYEDIPASTAYPEDAIVAAGYRRYFTSSVAYMLALAAHSLDHGDEVHLFGVDLSNNTEYDHQRPCAEYWMGRLEGKGITVTIPTACPLLRGPAYGKPDPDEPRRLIQQQMLERRIKQLMTEKAEFGAKFNAWQGRIEEVQQMRALLADR